MTYFLKCVLLEDYHVSETGSSKWNNCLNFLPGESLPGKKILELVNKEDVLIYISL